MIKGVIKLLFAYLKYFLISPEFYARSIGVKIGKQCNIFTMEFSTEPYLIEIGDHVAIAQGVTFLTHDGGVWVFRKEIPDFDVFGKIKVGDNSMIGNNTVILPGVKIGKNCVIGAGSIVADSIPDNTVAAGSPCRFICSIDAYRERMLPLNAKTKSLNPRDKKKAILSLPEDRLSNKKYIDLSEARE